jgi:hypothetical protein
VLTSPESLPPLFKFTIDVHGIKGIERLYEWPAYDDRTMKQLAFIVMHVKDMPNIYIELKVRRLLAFVLVPF